MTIRRGNSPRWLHQSRDVGGRHLFGEIRRSGGEDFSSEGRVAEIEQRSHERAELGEVCSLCMFVSCIAEIEVEPSQVCAHRRGGTIQSSRRH